MVAAQDHGADLLVQPAPPVKQGTFVHGESIVMFSPSEGGKAEPILPVAEIPLKGEHNVENVLAAVCAARLAGIPAEIDPRLGRRIQGRRASAGVRARHAAASTSTTTPRPPMSMPR